MPGSSSCFKPMISKLNNIFSRGNDDGKRKESQDNLGHSVVRVSHESPAFGDFYRRFPSYGLVSGGERENSECSDDNILEGISDIMENSSGKGPEMNEFARFMFTEDNPPIDNQETQDFPDYPTNEISNTDISVELSGVTESSSEDDSEIYDKDNKDKPSVANLEHDNQIQLSQNLKKVEKSEIQKFCDDNIIKLIEITYEKARSLFFSENYCEIINRFAQKFPCEYQRYLSGGYPDDPDYYPDDADIKYVIYETCDLIQNIVLEGNETVLSDIKNMVFNVLDGYEIPDDSFLSYDTASAISYIENNKKMDEFALDLVVEVLKKQWEEE